MNRLKLLAFGAILLFINVLTPALAQKKKNGLSDAQAVLQVMMNQQKAWNQGKLEGFMEGYWKNDSLIFIGKRGPSYGWLPVMNNYRTSYPDTAAMGKLRFEKLEVRVLSKRNAWVLGRWELSKKDKTQGGWFTLLFEKIKGQWLIVADHTGSDPQ